MKPLQVWLPDLNSDAPDATRDRARALDSWKGEVTVWLLPELEKPFRWRETTFKTSMALPSECLNRLDVYHISTDGIVYGPRCKSRFRNGRIDDLLDQWLNCQEKMALAPTAVRAAIPELDGNRVVYKERQVKFGPTNSLPLNDAGGGTFTASWPPPDQRYQSISPDSESAEVFGPIDPLVENGITMGVERRSGRRTLWTVSQWPDYIQQVVAGSGSLDILRARQQMRSIAALSAHDIDSALVKATKLAAPNIEDGHTYQALSWFYPAYTSGGDQKVVWEAEDYFDTRGRRFEDANDLLTQPGFLDVLRKQVGIRRAWGATGLFWALLLDRLEQRQAFRVCKLCSRILSGRSDKESCSQQDNPKCFNQRRAKDQRLSRMNRGKSESHK